MKLCSRLGEQWVSREKLDAVRLRFEMLGVADFWIVLRIRFVVANSAKMAKKLARGDGPFLHGECRAIFLHRSVQINFAALPKPHRSRSRQRLRNRTEPVKRARSGRDGIFKIGEPKSFGPNQLAIFNDRGGNSRRVGSGHK